MLEFLNKIGVDTSGYNGLRLDWSPPSFLWVGLFMAAAALAMYAHFRGTTPLDRNSRRAWLWGLRSVGLALLFGATLDPALVMEQREPVRPRLAMLWDTSRSMGLQSGDGSSTRMDSLKAFYRGARKLRERLEKDYIVDVMGFDRGVNPLGGNALEEGPFVAPSGGGTDILAALKTASQPKGDAPLAAVILLSDGADNAGLGGMERHQGELEALLADYPAPVYSVISGGGDLKDIGITDVAAPDYGFIRNAIEINLTIHARGFNETDVPVTLMEGDRVLTSRNVRVGPSSEIYPLSLTFSPDRVGTFLYTLQIPTYEGESVLENNRRAFSLQVLRDKIRVLHVVGSPSWDERFLREALKKDPTIELISFYILREPRDNTAAHSSELSLIPFPVPELFDTKLRTFDLLIFQDFSWRQYIRASYLNNIRDFVMDFGGGFMMIGGDRSFSEGGYNNTPLDDILPVELSDSSSGFMTDEFKPRLTEAGGRHPITALRPDLADSKAFWESLPPLDGFNPSLGAKPGSTVLLEHPFQTSDSRNMPVMAVSDVGRGRVLALMTDSSWHWNYLRAESGAGKSDYLRMWRSAVRWLVGDPEGKKVRVRTDKIRYNSSEMVKIRVRALDKDYAPAPKPDITLKLAGPDDTRAIKNLRPEGDEWAAEIDNPGAGGWRLEAEATSEKGEFMGADETVFVVEGQGLEFAKPWPNPGLLEKISRITGGGTWQAGDSPDADDLPSPKAWRVAGQKHIKMWDNWLTGALLLLFIASEWYLRRRWGLN